MDQRERYANPEEVLRAGIEALRTRIFTTLPGIVQSFDAEKMTVSVQPSINGVVRNQDGTLSSVQMPLVLDCPLVFQGGGGMTLAFSPAKGDECVVHFSARCIDNWFEQGGVQDAPEFRMHDLSDGFAVVGLRSLPRAFTIDAGVCRLRSDDDSTYLEMNPTAKTFKVVASGGATINGVNIDSSGNITNADAITASGAVTGSNFKSGTDDFLGHTHTSASPGSPTSPPITGT